MAQLVSKDLDEVVEKGVSEAEDPGLCTAKHDKKGKGVDHSLRLRPPPQRSQ